MAERKISFKQALNDLIRESQKAGPPKMPYRSPAYSMGPPLINLDKALQLAGELEDDELIRRMEINP